MCAFAVQCEDLPQVQLGLCREQARMADLNMGCSKNALALNYLPAEGIDVETCCDFGPPQDEGPDTSKAPSKIKVTFAEPIELAKKRVAFANASPSATDRAQWCKT